MRTTACERRPRALSCCLFSWPPYAGAGRDLSRRPCRSRPCETTKSASVRVRLGKKLGTTLHAGMFGAVPAMDSLLLRHTYTYAICIRRTCIIAPPGCIQFRMQCSWRCDADTIRCPGDQATEAGQEELLVFFKGMIDGC